MALFRECKNMGEVEKWMAERAPALRLKTEIVPIGRTDGWGFTSSAPGDGPIETTELADVSRADGRFFRVVGAQITRGVDGRIQKWGQPLIAGSKFGHMAFVRERQQGRFLLQLLAEPGNVGVRDAADVDTRVLIASTFQASPDNMAAALKSIAENGDPRAVARYLPLVRLEDTQTWARICEDGGRFFEKVNGYSFVDMPSIAATEAMMADVAPDAADFAWVKRSVLDRLVLAGLVNSHGVQAYGVARASLT